MVLLHKKAMHLRESHRLEVEHPRRMCRYCQHTAVAVRTLIPSIQVAPSRHVLGIWVLDLVTKSSSKLMMGLFLNRMKLTCSNN